VAATQSLIDHLLGSTQRSIFHFFAARHPLASETALWRSGQPASPRHLWALGVL